MKADDIRRVIDRADVEFSDGEKEELLNTLTGEIRDTAMITGVVTAEEVESVDHHDGCSGVQWVTSHKADALELDEYDDLDDSTAVCDNCGVEADIGETDVERNVVVDVAGAEDIADLIANGTGVSYDRMKIGSTTSPSAPAEGDTQLSNTVATSPTLTPTQQSTGGAQKKVVWSNTFASSTGRSSVVSMGMDTQTATGTQAHLLNRVTFSAKDNANNDLALTYELTVS